MNRSKSLRGNNNSSKSSGKKFSFASLRNGGRKSDLSSAMYGLIKTENSVVSAYESAAQNMNSVAQQLSQWGADAEDEHISDISDKLGVIMSEIASTEENYAGEIEDARVSLKTIRNTESSVQPSRDHREKLIDQIHNLKHKEPTSPKLVDLELQLVRAEAENLVAEAQLTNIQRHALKETYNMHFAALIERSEKNLILAEHGRRILEFLDDTPVVPGDSPSQYTHEAEAKQVLLDCEEELKEYRPKPYDQQTSRLASNGLPEQSEHEETHEETHEDTEVQYTEEAGTDGAEPEMAAPITK